MRPSLGGGPPHPCEGRRTERAGEGRRPRRSRAPPTPPAAAPNKRPGPPSCRRRTEKSPARAERPRDATPLLAALRRAAGDCSSPRRETQLSGCDCAEGLQGPGCIAVAPPRPRRVPRSPQSGPREKGAGSWSRQRRGGQWWPTDGWAGKSRALAKPRRQKRRGRALRGRCHGCRAGRRLSLEAQNLVVVPRKALNARL